MSEDTSCSALVLWRPWPFDPVPRSSPTTAIKEAPELTEIVPPSSPEVTLSVFHDATNVLQGPSSSSSTHHAPKVAVNTHYLSLIRGPQVSPSCHTIRLPPSPGLQHLPRTSISWPTSLTLPTSAHSLPYNAPINEDIVGGDPQDIVMDEPSDAAEVANQMDVDEERVPEGGGSSFTPALVTTSSYQGGDPGEHAPMTAADTVLHLSSTTPLQPVMGSWTTSDPISLSTPKRPGVFLPPKRTPVSVSDHAPNTPIAKVDQWRVGKRPGHQGSHMHNKRRSEALSEDEGSGVSTRVLKRPFRPPTRVSPFFTPNSESTTGTATDTASSSPPSARSGTSTSAFPSPTKSKSSSNSTSLSILGTPSTLSSPSISRRQSQSQSQSQSTTPSSTASTATRARVSKPFKSPTVVARSAAPSPPSIASRSSYSRSRRNPNGNANDNDPDADLVAALEARVRTLRQAVRYATAPDEDDRLARLVGVWRDAGRHVADKLFELVPRPEEREHGGVRAREPRSWGFGFGFGAYADGYDADPFIDTSTSTSTATATSEAGHRGEFVLPPDTDDPDGSEEDLDVGLGNVLKGARSVRRYGAFRPSGYGDDMVTNDTAACDDVDECNPSPDTWDRGAMLLKLGVDPGLLGFDREADDWEEIVDE